MVYLCFNRLLAGHVEAGLERAASAQSVQVHHVHALYHALIEDAGLLPRLRDMDANAPDFFSRGFPELASEALCEKSHAGWDVLVVDEAQDLLTPEHLDVFDLLLRDGLSGGGWHLFLDPKQNIYGEDVQSMVAGRLAAYSPTFDDLFENCRNTRQVAVQTSIVSGIDLPVTGAADGPDTGVHYYVTQEEAVRLIEELIGQLVDAQVRPDDIAILSTRRLENSLLAGYQRLAGFRLLEATGNAEPCKGDLLFSTMHAFKGLERQTVVAVDMAEIGEDHWSMLHYTGLSRARVLLHVFLPAAAKGSYEKQALAFGSRLQGPAP